MRQAVIEAQLTNLAGSPIRGEAQLISPYGSWQQAGPWTTGFAVQAGGQVALQFTVDSSGHCPARPAVVDRGLKVDVFRSARLYRASRGNNCSCGHNERKCLIF